MPFHLQHQRRLPHTIAYFFLAALLLCSSTFAQAAEKRLLTPQDLWAVKRVDNPAVSPDKKRVAFTVQEWSVEKNKATTNIWLVDISGASNNATPRRLTTAETNDGAPVWSPDGSRIAFTSKRSDDEAPALYILRLDGGEAEKVLELPYGVSNPKWLPDGDGLVVASNAIPALKGQWEASDLAAMKREINRRKTSKMTAKVSEDRQFRFFDRWLTDELSSHLLRFDLASKTIKDLTPQSVQLFNASGEANYDIAPDGKNLVLSMNIIPAPHREADNMDLLLIPTDGSGTMKNLTNDNRGGDFNPRFSPDGRSIFYSRVKSPYFDGSFAKLWRVDLGSGNNQAVTEAQDLAVGDFAIAADGKKLWLTSEDKGQTALFSTAPNGSDFAPVLRLGSIHKVRTAGTQLVFLNETMSQPNELFLFDTANQKLRQISNFNDAFMSQFNLGKVESYSYKGANDETVQAWLILPPNFDANKRYPLLQLMHGGPHTMVGDAWSYRWNAHVMAAPGYVVTWVNRHGSTGFGEKFAQSISGQWGDMPTEDILRSTDLLLQRFPNIDSNRVAAAGGSYGGYMAAWLAGHSDRFATLINHAGVNDFIAQYGADITNYTFERVLGGSPWNNPEGMQKNNPMTYAKNFKTPMLILHGELDYRVPYVNGTAMYGILQGMQIPTRLVIFPNENHWILSPQNSIYWNWEVQSWLQKYIGGTPTLSRPNF
ncbi:MAG: S9 family peptidase [Burkholderiaceae bacterium]|nr:S9 family peptidase [Burkholderiaceae bacterium]